MDEHHRYSFSVIPSITNGLVHDTVTHEPNNTISGAYPIELSTDGTLLTSQLTADKLDSADYYSIDLVKDQTYTLQVKNDSTIFQRDIFFKVTNANGSIIYLEQRSNSGSAGNYQFVATSSGKAVIRIAPSAHNVDEHHRYSFSVTKNN